MDPNQIPNLQNRKKALSKKMRKIEKQTMVAERASQAL